MQVYHHPLSTYARRIRILVEEKKTGDVEFVHVDMPNREHRSETFLALNPYGKVPVLKDGDLVLYESTAILEYLEARYPEPSLTPDDIEGRALMSQHMKLCDNYMANNTGIIIFPKRFMPPERWDRDAMEKAKAAIERHFAVMEPQLAGKRFLLGDQFTLADICYAPFIQFLPLMEIEPPAAVAAWVERVLNHPSVAPSKPAV